MYGVNETNGLVDANAFHQHNREHDSGEFVHWNDERLLRVTRLRLLSDPGLPWWDVSYCLGELKPEYAEGGRNVCRVSLPFSQLPKKGRARAIVEFAIADGVHAKRLGVLDNISTLC